MIPLVALLFFLPAIALAGVSPYLSLHTFTYSEPITIQNILNDSSDSFTGGEDALTHNWAEIGATYNNFGVGILSRYDYDLEFSEDTAEFYYLIENKKSLPQGRVFDLYLETKHTQSDGVRFSYTHTFKRNINVNIGLSYLRGVWLTEGKAQGQGVALTENDYDFQFDVNSYDSEDMIFERKIDSPEGTGYSIDFSLDWEVNQQWEFNLRVIDLIGRMYWEYAPYTTAVASSDNKEYDDDGYLIYKPVLSGYEGNADFTQELKPQIKALVNYQWNNKFAALGQLYSFYTANFYQLGLGYSFNQKSLLSMLYMFETNAITIGYEMQYFQFMITSDAFQFDDANTFALSLNATIKF